MNELTKRLYAEGWARDHHPDNVYWSDYENLGYKFDYLLKTVWKTGCGLLADGRSVACGDTSFGGIEYCSENDNPLIRCPYGKKDCKHIPAGFPFPECPCRMTDEPYDYERSLEKVQDGVNRQSHEQYMEITGGAYCACVVGSNGYLGGNVQVAYDVQKCISFGCENTTCVILKKDRDLARVNIFYDVRRTWITKEGIIEDTRVEVTKGVKVFRAPVARTDAEIWLKTKQAEYNPIHDKCEIAPRLTPDDRKQAFFSKHHRSWPGYDYFEFHYEVENIRIAKSEQKNLIQDLRDVAEGISVLHASDLQKAAAAQKKERRANAKEQRVKKAIKVLQSGGAEERKVKRAWSVLEKAGVDLPEDSTPMPKEPEYEQVALF